MPDARGIYRPPSAVTHHVEGASFPNWIGTDPVRQYVDRDSAGGDRPTFTTRRQLVAGRRIVRVLVWRRAP